MARRLLYTNNEIRFFLSHRAELALAAKEAGFDVHVAAPQGPGEGELRALGFSFHPFRMGRGSIGPAQEALAIADLTGLYRRLRPDIVHHVAIKAVLYGGIAARITGVPAVVSAFTGLGFLFSDDRRARVLRALAKPTFHFSLSHRNSRTIFQNDDDRALLVRSRMVPAANTVVIRGSGVSLERFRVEEEPERTSPLVVFPARLLWSKGIREFVDAARLVKERRPCRFALVGDLDASNPTAVSREIVTQWVADGTVEWWGFQRDMHRVFSEANVVCLPSYREGLPKALIEAAACGRAIVTTDIAGCRDTVVPNESGLLVPPRQAQPLADAILRLVNDRDLRLSFGAAGRRLVEERFGLQRVLRETLGIYEALAS